MNAADIMVTDYGTLVGFLALTEAGEIWLYEHLPADVPCLGKAMYAEHRYAPPIVEGMIEDGLKVLVNAAREVN